MNKLIMPLIPILVIMTCTSTLSRAEQPLLTIHAVDFPPYEIENPGVDSLLGFDVEVVIEAFARVGRRARVDFRPWKRIVAMAQSGATLAMLSCEKSPGREKFINYSDPISKATRTYVASADFTGNPPQKMEDAKGSKVLVVSGYAAEKELIAAHIPYEPIIDDTSALRVLLNRDYDLFYSAREYVQYVAGGMGIAEKVQYFDTGKQVLFHLCFSKKWPDSMAIRDKFNQGLAEIMADGTYTAIHAKYK
ncbi:substrate-binding periplasmic protein [Kiloniella antarctica]|uniref:Substrate-binding periplasmic protein n=1 Tax=Kiloniella antarctica TaxID=1550907 RepID=A0ABW5BLM0_9PROT